MLSKTKSKKVWKLKYLLLVPIVLGMLAYTSVDNTSTTIEASLEMHSDDDKKLILEIKDALDTEIEQLLIKGVLIDIDTKDTELVKRFKAISYIKVNFVKEYSGDAVYAKKEFFKAAILRKMYLQAMEGSLKSNDDSFNKRMEETISKIGMPSTNSYDSYVSRKMAFLILDKNLQYSIKAYEQTVELVDLKDNYRSSSYLFEVKNVKDLTGEEIRSFNNRLSRIFDKYDSSTVLSYSDLILTDGEYAFRIFTGLPKVDLQFIENSTLEGQEERSANTIKLNVNDFNNRTNGEKKQEKELMNEIRNSAAKDTLVVTDGKRSQEITTNSEGHIFLSFKNQSGSIPFSSVEVPPVFPGCEKEGNRKACFNKMLMKHISKNFNYPKEAQEKGMQGSVSITFMITEKGAIKNIRTRGPHELLEAEAYRIINRLPKMQGGEHKGKSVNVSYSIPITFKLNSNSKFEIGKTISRYNQLINERKRLLVKPDENNSRIKNLNEQIANLNVAIERGSIVNNKSEGGIKNFENDLVVPFAVIDEVPIFPGCENEANPRACFNQMMQKHISKNFNYPKEAQEKGIQGRVSVLFVISKDGSIQDLKVRGPVKLLEDESVRIVSRLPKMTPGKHKGEIVAVPYSIPITFKLK